MGAGTGADGAGNGEGRRALFDFHGVCSFYLLRIVMAASWAEPVGMGIGYTHTARCIVLRRTHPRTHKTGAMARVLCREVDFYTQ